MAIAVHVVGISMALVSSLNGFSFDASATNFLSPLRTGSYSVIFSDPDVWLVKLTNPLGAINYVGFLSTVVFSPTSGLTPPGGALLGIAVYDSTFSLASPTSGEIGEINFSVQSVASSHTIAQLINGPSLITEDTNVYFGSNASETFAAGSLPDILYGVGGNDTLKGLGSNDTLFGGDGDDTIYGDDSSTPLLTANALSIRRLYLATLDRGPDAIGWTDWTGKLDAGQSLVSITTGFVASPEFQAKYGALDNTQFVTLLYNNVLHRAPDPTGLNNWLGALNGGASREAVVNGFSESQEFKNSTDSTNFGGEIYRLYGATLDRAPDATGFNNWTSALANNKTLDSIAGGFVNSAEFQAKYGALDNAGFVTLLYNNVLHRAPDATGLNGWVSQLAGGATRTSVVLGFSESSEYQHSTRAGYVAFATTTFASSVDALDGGPGNDTLVGGAGPDWFTFNKGESGSDHIYGFETVDRVELFGFGYANAAAAQSHLAQVGADTVFTDQGETITFHNFSLAAFTQDIWILG